MKAKKGRERTQVVTDWVRQRGKSLAKLNSIQITEKIEQTLGFRMPANQIVRILRKNEIPFQSLPDDPKPQNYSKVDLLKAQLVLLEKRVTALEKIQRNGKKE